MKYALVYDQLQEAQPGLSGKCPCCGGPMIARCGRIKVEHWSHHGKRDCDPWWETETEWHRTWKSLFPKDWQEFVQHAENGERHIADVRNDQARVIEFQNSAICPDERAIRTEFYKKMVWVVNGLRLQRDQNRFFSSLKEIASINGSQFVRRVFSVVSKQGALLRDWNRCPAPVFFDFGESEVLWCLLPFSEHRGGFVVEFSRTGFIRLMHFGANQKDYFSTLISHLEGLASDYISGRVGLGGRINYINELSREIVSASQRGDDAGVAENPSSTRGSAQNTMRRWFRL